MLWQSCLIAVAVMALLSTFILLRSKYASGCSASYRTRAETSREDSAVPDDVDSLHTLAAAFCLIAAGAHSKDPGNQQQLGSVFYDLCCTGFEGITADPAVKAFVDGLELTAKKAKKK
jgi:hypothetical protein